MNSQQNGTPDASAPNPSEDERKKAMEQAQKDAAEQREQGGYQ